MQTNQNLPPPKTQPKQLLRYIRYAKSLQPQISEESRRKLVTCYRCVSFRGGLCMS
jgi:DNA replicative helicase MCM subunit Mcm2 (Cdc46/Mcm family)